MDWVSPSVVMELFKWPSGDNANVTSRWHYTIHEVNPKPSL
jgi:hypothetical protein